MGRFPSRPAFRFLVALAAVGVAASLQVAAFGREIRQTQGQRASGPGTSGTTQGQRAGGQGAQATQPARDPQTQQITSGTGTISGTVTLEGSGTPLRHARVTLSGTGLRPSRVVSTGDQGQFAFTMLPSGHFTMAASKPGYVDMAYGAKKPGRPGTPIQLTDGQTIDKLTLPIPKGSVITGTVVDENGEPSPGTQVRVLRYVLRTGEKSLQQSGSEMTDDRGVYRIYGQLPGDYIVSAVPRNANINDLRQTMLAEIDSLIQQANAANATPGGPGGSANTNTGGGGRQGGRAGAGLGPINGYVGRGQTYIDQANALQQQLQQQSKEQTVAYAPVYYPGTSSSSAAVTITLGVGEERGGVDFQLQLVPTARVDGTITSATGSLPPATLIQLTPAGQGGVNIPGANVNNARANPDGRFSFSNVTPGQYTITARAQIRQQNASEQAVTAQQAQLPQTTQPGRGGFAAGGRGGGPIAQVLWAATDVTVSGQNIPDVVLNLQPGMTVSGQVAFQGSTLAPPTDLTRVRVVLQPRGSQSTELANGIPPAQVDATGHFSITGVPPGVYMLQGSAPVGGTNVTGGRGASAAATSSAGNWTLKSAVVGGRDTLDFPLEVQPNTDVGGAVLTFSDHTQELDGTLVDASGRPTSDYTIIMFPADKAYWLPQSRRIQSARPGTDGTFTLRGMPPGDYRLIAVTDVETGEWYDPDFLTQLAAAAMPISLAEGEKKVQDLRIAGGGDR